MKKKLLYIGHQYHNKTKSTQFLKGILAEQYEVETFDFDPYSDNLEKHFLPLKGRFYDVVCIFQIMPHLNELKKIISFDRSVFFPMFDDCRDRKDSIWNEYTNTQIINFSFNLHTELSKKGFSSHYIQYFPKPFDNINEWGNLDSVFFWQRINDINVNTIYNLLNENNINNLHIHKALDPMHKFVEPNKNIKWSISYSDWFEKKDDMLKEQQKSAIYIAPRTYEGIGMSFLDAMAIGRCVIAPNNPTMNEYIVDKFNGYLYNSKEIKPIKLGDIREIQKNTLEYIKQGYNKWKQEQHMILEWIEEDVYKYGSLSKIFKNILSKLGGR